jgi:hypothetical protein
MSTSERCVAHKIAWSLEQRKSMMRDVVKEMAKAGVLHRIDAPAYARTYGVNLACVEAEMMRHLSEGSEGK